MKLFNFLTRKKEEFKPLKDKKAGMYACGPTVYNFAHIGNLRTYIFEDVLRRTLELAGYKVKQIMNITDIDDKIIREAAKNKKTAADFVKPFKSAFFEDLKLLNIKPAQKYPLAADHIPEMIGLISRLLKTGLAYKSQGSVYFDISKFKSYGKLNRLKHRKKSGIARHRIDVDEYTKLNVEDFALWKAGRPGEPSWSAPFGKGRPGWHIECSAMSMKYLGRTFDIHTGAVDLLFPHHENEIAQSEGATKKAFAKFFIEGEHLLINGQKMSKSLGNVYTLRDFEKRKLNPLAFRYFVLTAHYRSKLNFTWEGLKAAGRALERIKERVFFLRQTAPIKDNLKFRKKSAERLNDDLDMPGFFAVFWNNFDRLSLNDILRADQILGLNLKALKSIKIPPLVKKLAETREKWRKEKKWGKADATRNRIKKLGWLIEDLPSGPIIKPLK
ncbi:MAG: cysteine--tRNA ligase [Patescibacteria group bacterium]